jgi:hypothetical protein
MALWQWSTTPASNATAGSINWAEGQAPSTVNDSARQMMADVATWFQSPEWMNYGLTPTYVSATQFTVAGNQTGVYSVGRRVKATVTSGTEYGTISTSVFGALTTVTVTWDSGSLDSGLSRVDVGVLNPTNPSLPNFPRLTLNAVNGDQGTLTINGTADTSYGASIALLGNGATTPNKYLRVLNGVLSVVNSAYSQQIFSVDDSGNVVAGGNVTASSDERLKTGWESMPDDFLERLAAVKSGTYERIDTNDGKRHAGVGAQSLREVLPEAVLEGAQGMLSVAYGNVALVAVIELTREVLRLRDELLEVRHLTGV